MDHAMTYFTPSQHEKLLAPIRSTRVGKDRKNNSHVEAYEIRAHLNRLIGFGRWSQRVTAMEPIFEHLFVDESKGKEKDRVTVAYRAQVTLDVHAPDGTHLATYTEWAMGDAQNFPASSRGDAHDFAIKTAESQGLKRCAVNLGDQFGLSLYRKGSLQALVGVTLVHPVGMAAPVAAKDVDEHITEPLPAESEQVEDKRETNAPKPPVQPREDTRKPVIDAVREQALNPPDSADAMWWAKLQLDAGKAKVLNAKTTDADGNAVTVAALIQTQMVKRAA